MEKTKAYLINVLFILFHKHEGNPAQCAKAVSHAVREAIFTLYPKGQLENGVKHFRLQWTAEFASELMVELQNVCNEISGNALGNRRN